MVHELTQPYLRIVKDVREQICSGRLAPHVQLPSNRELRDQYGVAAGTVQRALNELRSTGFIYSHQGRGSYVRADAPQTSPTAGSDVVELQRQLTELTGRLERLEQSLKNGGVQRPGEPLPPQEEL